MRPAVLFLVLLSCVTHASAGLSVIAINTEWLWDHQPPHDGRIIGKDRPAPSKQEYLQELGFFAELIVDQDVNVVGLSEIEGCHVAKNLAYVLGEEWQAVCSTGRDRYTGQDVAILTRLAIHKSTIDTFKHHYGYVGSKRVRPSKVLSVVAEMDDGKPVVLTVAHLLSRRGNNDDKRAAQAQAISAGIQAVSERYGIDRKVLMGDFNDTPNSRTLKVLKGGSFVNPASAGQCSHTYRSRCDLIDHVLVSPSLSGGSFSVVRVPEHVSDHSAVLYRQ